LGTGQGLVLAKSNGRAATRGGGEVIELECGITVYPARTEAGRWRAVWYEDGQRQQCEAATGEKLDAKREKVKIRLNLRPEARAVGHMSTPASPRRRSSSRTHGTLRS
jgi:hypothetical protein